MAKDWNKDGMIDGKDADVSKVFNEIEIKNRKMESQKSMAWFSLIMIAIVTIFMFTPFVSDSRINALSDLLGLFYISCAGITGAYVGVTAWISRKGGWSSHDPR